MAEENERVNAAELQESLKGIDYPARREDLVETAKSNEAPDQVINFLEQMPDKEYETPVDVSEQLGEETTEEAGSDEDMAA